MRLIDADAFLQQFEEGKAILKNCWYLPMEVIDGTLKLYAEVKERVDAMPTIEPEQRWIPCSERLPETLKDSLDIKYYLTCDKDGDINKIMWCDGWNCIFYNGSICRDFEMKDIVAWMPLPEPWEGLNG